MNQRTRFCASQEERDCILSDAYTACEAYQRPTLLTDNNEILSLCARLLVEHVVCVHKYLKSAVEDNSDRCNDHGIHNIDKLEAIDKLERISRHRDRERCHSTMIP